MKSRINTGFFSKKQFLCRIIMQLSTLVLKEDSSLPYLKPLSRLDVHVKFLLANYKAISHHMTVKACASHKTLPIPFELGSQTEKV